MDISKLSRGERIIAVAGVLLLIDALFLPWYRYRYCVENSTCPTASAGFVGGVGIAIGLAMAAQVLLTRFGGIRLPAPGGSWRKVHVFAGFATFALMLLQLMATRAVYTRAYGLFVAVGLAAALALGGMVRSREPESPTKGGHA